MFLFLILCRSLIVESSSEVKVVASSSSIPCRDTIQDALDLTASAWHYCSEILYQILVDGFKVEIKGLSWSAMTIISADSTLESKDPSFLHVGDSILIKVIPFNRFIGHEKMYSPWLLVCSGTVCGFLVDVAVCPNSKTQLDFKIIDSLISEDQGSSISSSSSLSSLANLRKLCTITTEFSDMLDSKIIERLPFVFSRILQQMGQVDVGVIGT